MNTSDERKMELAIFWTIGYLHRNKEMKPVVERLHDSLPEDHTLECWVCQEKIPLEKVRRFNGVSPQERK